MRSRGFTLIELMVAVLITAIIAVMGYTALNQASRNRGQLDTQAKRVLEVQRGLGTLQQDLELLAPRPVRDPLGNGVQPALIAGTSNSSSGSGNTTSSSTSTSSSTTSTSTGSTSKATLSTTSSISSTSNSGSSGNASGNISNLAQQSLAILSLTRGSWANPAGLQRTEEQRINYLMENGTLVRYHLPVLDPAGEVPTTRRELIHDVESIAFRFMDAGHAWQTNWLNGTAAGSGRQPQMRERPVAIEITIKLKDWGTITRIVEVAG